MDAGKAGEQHIPVRIVTPKGKANQAKYAAEVTATIIDRLENYFGIPYPFDKCDNVAIPLTFGFGAMENVGMVTYAQNLILSDPAIDTEERQRDYASVAAHELAHQWFGDLVTLAWWDDTWLNEAFATWTYAKILAEWKPEWHSRLSDLNGKFGAMGEDSLVAARKIRQPIESKDDISNAFDGITYQKGAGVIRMFESWVGEKKFQSGVTAYLKRYASRTRAWRFPGRDCRGRTAATDARVLHVPGATWFAANLREPQLQCCAGTLPHPEALPSHGFRGQRQPGLADSCLRAIPDGERRPEGMFPAG